MYEFWTFSHDVLGMHFYAIPTMVVALAGAITALVHHHNQKKRDEDFEKELAEKLQKNA